MALLGRFVGSEEITLNGSDVSQWGSTVDSKYVEQLTPANQPEFLSNAWLGHPGVVFDGTEYLFSPNTTDFDNTTNDWTMVYVGLTVPFSTAGSAMRMFGKTSNSTGNAAGYHVFKTSTDDYQLKFADGSSRLAVDSSAQANTGTQLQIVIGQYEHNDTRNLHVNGSLDNDVNQDAGGVLTSLTNSTSFGIGAVGDLGIPLQGTVLEIRVYDSAEDMGALYTELNNKYSVSANTAPTISIDSITQRST